MSLPPAEIRPAFLCDLDKQQHRQRNIPDRKARDVSDFPSSEAESCFPVLCRMPAGDEAEGHGQGRRTAAVRGGRVRRTAGPSCPGTQAEQRPCTRFPKPPKAGSSVLRTSSWSQPALTGMI